MDSGGAAHTVESQAQAQSGSRQRRSGGGGGKDVTAVQTHAQATTSTDDADRASASALRSRAHAGFSLWGTLVGALPILSWLPSYDVRSTLLADALAGVTVGLMVIPQGLGFATIAGVPQVYGLYSAFLGVFVYAALGGCKDISVGPTSILCLLSVQTTGGDPQVATQMALLMGALQIALAACNLGVLVDLISNPVLSGFTSAAALQIVLTQIGGLCGFKTRSAVYDAVYDVIDKRSELRAADLLLGLGSMLLLVLMGQLKSCRSPWLNILATGRNAVVVLLGGLISYIIAREHSSEESVVQAVPWKLVGHVPSGLPAPQIPTPSAHFLSAQSGNIALAAFVSFIESIAIAKAFAKKNNYAHKLVPNQELLAIGVCNLVGSFFQSLPVTGSFSRTAVASQAGARTQLQGVFTGLVVMMALVLLTPAFFYIPKAVLSAVVIMSANNFQTTHRRAVVASFCFFSH